MVAELVYYSQTTAFYKRYRDEINSLLYEFQSSTGIYNLKNLFGKRWDEEDPLIIEDYNQNLLAWFGFEETLRNIGYEFEELQECI